MPVPAYLRERSGALERGMQQLRNLHDFAVNQRDRLSNNDVDADVIHQTVNRLRDAKRSLADADSINGFWTYAQSEYQSITGDDTLDVQTEFTTTMQALDAALSAAIGTIPTDANGYLLDRQYNADGTFAKRTFAPSETSALQTELDNLQATIDVTP